MSALIMQHLFSSNFSYPENDAIFLDVFEHELRHIGDIPVPLKRLAMDPSLLLPPPTASGIVNKSSPSTSREGQKIPVRIDRFRRMPQSQVEHTQHAIEVFLLVHIWLESLLRVRSGESNRSLHLEASKSLLNNANADNSQLFSPRLSVDLSLVPGLAGLGDVPDPKVTLVHKAGDKLDLSSEALIGCTVESKGSHEKRFLVNYSQQLVLVEPDSKQIGWGVITFIGSLQDLEATCDPADSRCLHVNINQPGHLSSVACYEPPNGSNQRLSSKPLLCARFLFEDHIRCMTARQMLLRGREMARETKLRKIATLLDFSPQFIRDTFLGPGSGYNSASTFSNFEISSRAVAHGRFGVSSLSSASNTTDLSSGWSSRGLAPTTVRQHIPNRDPGAFLLERQNRLRSNRSYPDGDLSEGRLTLITLASRSNRSGSRQDKDDQNGIDPQSVSPSTANQKSGTNPVSFHVQPLLQQPVSPSLHSPRFTIMPPPDEESVPMNAPFSSPSIKPSSRSDNSVNTACISPRHSRLV
ncbi:hypothetical protein D915_006021 [Fasciola hepatica]|uniref:CLEC16A/TT9 C-terminal domain-containing protein n=1 Tax=Fasciola hepatica TaxID=6192 RepID=A0A4E0R5F3_FASHE|nr:hypothetical protein D915_006021 [Fasciola hepatica]